MFCSFHDVSLLGTLSSIINFTLTVQVHFGANKTHPLGGRDGKKDLKCTKGGLTFIGACYFPRGQQTFSVIKKKFVCDLKGVEKNRVDGFIFITNQEISDTERKLLQGLAEHPIHIFHLEILITILNKPINFRTRLEFLDIETTKEDMLAYFDNYEKTMASYTEKMNEFQRTLDIIAKGYKQNKNNTNFNELLKKTNHSSIKISKGDVYFADFGNVIDTELGGLRPVVIVSNYINNRYSPTVTVVPVTAQINKAKLPTHVELGFSINPERESVAVAEQIRTISKERLSQLITTLDTEIIEKINDAISIQMELFDF